MKRVRRSYAMSLTVIMCITCLIAGIITAEKNTRYLSFGEEFKSVDFSSITMEEIEDFFNIPNFR